MGASPFFGDFFFFFFPHSSFFNQNLGDFHPSLLAHLLILKWWGVLSWGAVNFEWNAYVRFFFSGSAAGEPCPSLISECQWAGNDEVNIYIFLGKIIKCVL